MPFLAELRYLEDGAIAKKVLDCPSIALAYKSSRVLDAWRIVDIFDLLILEDLFGKKRVAREDDCQIWSEAKNIDALWEEDLGDAQFCGLLGQWNKDFLRWLKLVSLTAKEEVLIYYEHERGDYLYEVAWWQSSPCNEIIESFRVESYDGMEEPEWIREVVRRSDGRVELREIL